MWILIRSVFSIESVALWTIIYCRQSQPFFPTIHKERTLPMSFTSSCRLFPVLSSFFITLEFVQQHLRRELLLRHRWLLSLSLLRPFTFDFIGRYLCFGINSTRFFGRLRCEHLCLQCISLLSNIYHVCWKRMPINPHRLFGCLKLEPTLLYSRLYLLTEYLALIGVMRCCIVPLAVLDILQLLICRGLMIWLQLDLSLWQQQVEDLVSLSNIEPIFLGFFVTERTWDRLLIVLNSFSRSHYLIIIWVRRIWAVNEIDLFLEVASLLLIRSCLPCHPVSHLIDAVELLRSILLLDVWQESLESNLC